MNENTGTRTPDPVGPSAASRPGPAPDFPETLDRAREWVEDHSTLALLGAFAAGVFLGALMRR